MEKKFRLKKIINKSENKVWEWSENEC